MAQIIDITGFNSYQSLKNLPAVLQGTFQEGTEPVLVTCMAGIQRSGHFKNVLNELGIQVANPRTEVGNWDIDLRALKQGFFASAGDVIKSNSLPGIIPFRSIIIGYNRAEDLDLVMTLTVNPWEQMFGRKLKKIVTIDLLESNLHEPYRFSTHN